MNKDICRIDQDNCKNGITIALWVKLVNSKIKLDDVMKDQKITVLSTKEFQFNFLSRNGKGLFKMVGVLFKYCFTNLCSCKV